jgi:hypothetical protein
MDTPMELGFFCWPYTPALLHTMAAVAQRYRYDVVGGGRHAGRRPGPMGRCHAPR